MANQFVMRSNTTKKMLHPPAYEKCLRPPPSCFKKLGLSNEVSLFNSKSNNSFKIWARVPGNY